jgi:hypothetical protein
VQDAISAAIAHMLLVEASPGCTLDPSQFYKAIAVFVDVSA